MKKALFVATVVKTHIMTFHIPYLKMLKEMGFETAVAARNDYENPEDCVIPYCDNYYDIPFERSPLKTANLKAYKALKRIIDEGDYDIIHCHTPVGAMLTRLAALRARKRGTKVIYTAHGFHFYKGAPLINWLLYFPVEWFLARFTDALITINKEDYSRAQKLAAKKVYYVPGVGIDTKKYAVSDEVRQENRMVIRNEFGIPEDATVLLSVGELIPRKNHRVVIEAISQIDNDNLYYIICGRGPLMESLKELAHSLDISNRVILTGFRNDIADFFSASDVFIFPSLQEGLPVAVMEAMASGLPVVCSNIRGNTDLANDPRYLFNPANTNDLKNALKTALDDLSGCVQKRTTTEYIEQFSVERLTNNLRDVYSDTIKNR